MDLLRIKFVKGLNLDLLVAIIGSGIGGLCCGSLLARYNQDVLVLESHDLPGGAVHSFTIKDYKFDSGPSLFSGFQSRGPQANPLAQVLDALGNQFPVRPTTHGWYTYRKVNSCLALVQLNFSRLGKTVGEYFFNFRISQALNRSLGERRECDAAVC